MTGPSPAPPHLTRDSGQGPLGSRAHREAEPHEGRAGGLVSTTQQARESRAEPCGTWTWETWTSTHQNTLIFQLVPKMGFYSYVFE